MRRIEVSRRLGSVEEVRASLAAHRGRLGDKLDVQRPAAPESGFSYQANLDHMDGQLAKVQSQLVDAEDQHVRQMARIRQLRRRRDQGAADTYDKQTAARGILASLYGKDRDFEVAAVSGKTPKSSKALAEQVDQTVKFLRSPEGEVPSSRVAGVGVDFAAMADDLKNGQQQLIEVRADLAQAEKQADGTRQTTARAIENFDVVFLWAARSLEGLFRFAGEQDLADRVRTSVRRVTRRQAEPEEEAAKEPAEKPAGSQEPPPAGPATKEPESAPSEATEEAQPPADLEAISPISRQPPGRPSSRRGSLPPHSPTQSHLDPEGSAGILPAPESPPGRAPTTSRPLAREPDVPSAYHSPASRDGRTSRPRRDRIP